MKRDADLIRAILKHMEDQVDFITSHSMLSEFEAEPRIVTGHLQLLEDAGYVVAPRSPKGAVMGWRLTWQAYEFIETTRDPEIWERTKAGAAKVGSASFPFLIELAKGFIKAKAVQAGFPML